MNPASAFDTGHHPFNNSDNGEEKGVHNVKVEPFYRDSWAEVNLDHIDHNIQTLKQRLQNETEVWAVVKANAYGHGDIQVAKQAVESGAGGLAVAILDEALRLREAGFQERILVMGWIRPEDAPLAAEHDIEVTIFQVDWLQKAGTHDYDRPLLLHMKWDTGMGRIGIRSTEEMDEIMKEIHRHDAFQLQAVFTHFATADEESYEYLNMQEDRFQKLFAHFERVWEKDVEIHTGNSAASMRFPNKMKHFVRFGISLYGLYPSQVVKREQPINLKPAFSLHSRLIHVKKVEAGESISYGATYTTKEPEWIGTVPVGYADGWLRKLQGMSVLVDGKRRPIVGRICMDQFMILLDQEYPIGTKVTLIGKQNQDEIETDDVAEYLDTINYEVPCMISSRIPRVFIKESQ